MGSSSEMDYSSDKSTLSATEYDLTLDPGALPQDFLVTAKCDRLYVEFLKTPLTGMTAKEKDKASNHAVFKLVFNEEYDGFAGLRLAMEVDRETASSVGIDGTANTFQKGYLKAKTTTGAAASSKSLLTVHLDIDQGWTVGQLIQLLHEKHLDQFYYIDLEDKYYGCRDFVSQAIGKMVEAKFLKSLDLHDETTKVENFSVENIYAMMGLRVNHMDQIIEDHIQKGFFSHKDFKRIEHPDLKYC